MWFKKIIKKIPVIRDYLAFQCVYYDSASLFLFIKFRWFPHFRKKIYWPISTHTEVRGNVIVGKGARVGHRPFCIIQGRGRVFIGDYVEIGPHCVVISGNHDLLNQNKVVRKETIIGDDCWLASSCMILAGVVLGPRTIVGAGSVVTKSFPNGYCVIAGNPAKIVKTLSKDDITREHPFIEYYGYIRADKFPTYMQRFFSHLKFEYELSKVTANNDLVEFLSTR